MERPINTSEQIPLDGQAHLMGILRTRGYVRVGCEAPARGFAKVAEGLGVPVTVTYEDGGWIIRKERD
jgi:hypothetical protein